MCVRKSQGERPPKWMLLLALAPILAMASGCPPPIVKSETRHEVRPAMVASEEELITKYNEQARAVRAIRATVTFLPKAGSTYNGVMTLKEYHEFNGFILARKPGHIRVIGQAPVVGTNLFDMVSDGSTFRMYIPPKNKFVTGPAALEKPSKNAIENLRPQHILDAIFWPEISAGREPLLDSVDALPDHFYVLIETRAGSKGPEIARKIWFDRADLNVARVQIYMAGGKVASDIQYSDWQTAGATRYPRHIVLDRTQDDYSLDIKVSQLAVNEEIADDRFELKQPTGTELVQVGEEATGKKPAEKKPEDRRPEDRNE